VDIDEQEEVIKLVGKSICLKVRGLDTEIEYEDVSLSKSQNIARLYELIKRQVITKAGEKLIISCNSINLNDMFDKTMDETNIENGNIIGVSICQKTADSEKSLLADVKNMRKTGDNSSKSTTRKRKVSRLLFL